MSVFQLFVVDGAEIGLLSESDAEGRIGLNETMDQLAEAIEEGLTGTVDNCRYGVISMRHCISSDDITTGCSHGTVVAIGQPVFNGSYSILAKPVIAAFYYQQDRLHGRYLGY